MIGPSHQTYGHKTMIEKLFGKSSEVKKTSAELGGFYLTSASGETLIPEMMKLLKPAAAPYNVSNEIELFGKIHLPMFEQRTSIPGGLKLKLKLIPQDPSFYFKCATDVKLLNVEYTECYITLKGEKVNKNIVEVNDNKFA